MSTTIELTWQYDLNHAYAPSSAQDLGQYSVWITKAILMAQVTLKDATGATIGSPSGAWTCMGSSDGTTGAIDAVDRWTSTYTPAKLVRGTSTTTGSHSWIVLKSPWNLYILLSFVDGSSNYSAWHVGASWSAYTGGTSTADPTTTNEILPESAATGTALHVMTTSTNINTHGWLATNGDAMIVLSRNGAGFASYALLLRQLTETRSGDSSNGWLYTEYDDTSGVLRAAGSQSNNGLGTGAAGWQGRTGTPATAPVAAISESPAMGATSGSMTSVLADLVDPDPIDGKTLDRPVRLYAYSAAQKSGRGRVQDCCWAPHTLAQAKVEPSTGPPYVSAKIGDWFVPWQGMSAGPSF